MQILQSKKYKGRKFKKKTFNHYKICKVNGKYMQKSNWLFIKSTKNR